MCRAFCHARHSESKRGHEVASDFERHVVMNESGDCSVDVKRQKTPTRIVERCGRDAERLGRLDPDKTLPEGNSGRSCGEVGQRVQLPPCLEPSHARGFVHRDLLAVISRHRMHKWRSRTSQRLVETHSSSIEWPSPFCLLILTRCFSGLLKDDSTTLG